MNTVSVVIPTHNRCDKLQKAILSYLDQTKVQAIAEIIVVDDGSTDSTGAVVAGLAKESVVPIRYLRQENKGPAAARNVGIREAASELILFTDDDIIPGPSLVAEHLRAHEQNPEHSTAVLGYVTWWPALRHTPFMRWYGEAGSLFAFSKLRENQPLDFCFFYTCNLSLKTAFVRAEGGFDEDFKIAAYEDIELGYRLSRAGLRLLYNPRALGYHYQYFTFADACRKARNAKTAAQIFSQKEAGRFLLQRERERKASLAWRFARWFAGRVPATFYRGVSLLDARIPLPDFVYRAFFSHNTARHRLGDPK